MSNRSGQRLVGNGQRANCQRLTAVGRGGELYVNSYHRAVQRYGPSFGFAPGPVLSGAGADSAHPTGVAVDPASGRVYVDERTYLGVSDPSGAAGGGASGNATRL